ncbi:MAG: hypothetical protein AAF612_02305 [Planctomycetota bacterium]
MFRSHPFAALLIAVACAAGPAVAQDDAVAQAQALLEEDQPKQAYRLLVDEIDEQRMQDPRFMIALADAGAAYAPTVSMLNGGDRKRVDLYQGVGDLYQQVNRHEAANEAHRALADLGLARLKLTMQQETIAAMEQKGYEHALRLCEAAVELWPKEETAPMLIYQIGGDVQNREVQMRGLRALVAAETKEASTYTFLARLEQDADPDPETGGAAALAVLDAGIATIGDDMALLDAKARLLIQTGRRDEARPIAARMDAATEQVEDVAQRARYAFATGVIYDLLADAVSAENRYRTAVEQLPDNARLRTMLGGIYFNRAADAMRLAHDLPFDAEDQRQPLERQAHDALRLARTEFEAAREHGETNLTLLHSLANVYIQLGDAEAWEAIQAEIKEAESGRR